MKRLSLSAHAAAGLALLGATGARGDDAPSLPHPAPQAQSFAQRAADNAACERCHASIAQEWRTSRHHSSFTNPEFQRSVKRESAKAQAFCVGCHAPEASPGSDSDAAAQLGVSCVTCHVTGGAILAAPRSTPSAAPHAVTYSAAFASEESCGSCHEFQFFDPRPNPIDERFTFMQRTLREHYNGKLGDSTCATCHMPQRTDAASSHRSHAFPGGYSTELVKSALTVSARRASATSIELTLTPGNVTHSVPTGDLFRRIALVAEVVDSNGKRHAVQRYLARHHEQRHGYRAETGDTRVFQQPTLVTLNLGAVALKQPISYRVTYQRVDHLVGDDESAAVIAGEIVLADGTL